MRRYIYSNLLKIVFSSLLIIAFIPSAFCFICSLIIDKSLDVGSLIVILSCLLLRIFLELAIFILNRKASNTILFEEGRMLYKNRTVYSDYASIKYFKFNISIIEPSLAIPKVQINSNIFSVTCYLSKRDIKKLKKMNFEIYEI